MLILGIETACDDTSAAVVENGHVIRSNSIWTQRDVHEKWGGVMPEMAARRHVEVMEAVIEEALQSAQVTFADLDAVAVNHMHGLLRSIVVGVSSAKAIAFALDIPLIGIHHIEGHIYSNLTLNPDIEFPHLCLTVSGGHNLLLHVLDHGDYDLIGRTLDDAAGEAYDKVAKMLGLGFPGGAVIDRLAAQGDPTAFDFPRPMIDRNNYDFSFSGLKTAVSKVLEETKKSGGNIDAANIAASFQAAVVDVLVSKTVRAVHDTGVTTVTLAGGVAANSALRARLSQAGEEHNFRVFWPTLPLCTDNGAMVATVAYYKYRAGITSPLNINAYSNAPIGSRGVEYKPGKRKPRA